MPIVDIKFRDGGDEPGRRQALGPHAQASVGGGHVRQGATAQGAVLGAGNVSDPQIGPAPDRADRPPSRLSCAADELLAPRRMTKLQVADLVYRVRRGGYGTLELDRRDFRDLDWHITTKSRCAARYAKLTGCSLADAGLDFDITPGPVWRAWQDIYPGEVWNCRHGIGWTSCSICHAGYNRRWEK